MKRKADIAAILAGFVWLAIVWEWHDRQHVAFVPLVMVAAIAVTAQICHRLERWYEAEAAVAILALMAVMPFMFATFGGV